MSLHSDVVHETIEYLRRNITPSSNLIGHIEFNLLIFRSKNNLVIAKNAKGGVTAIRHRQLE